MACIERTITGNIEEWETGRSFRVKAECSINGTGEIEWIYY